MIEEGVGDLSLFPYSYSPPYLRSYLNWNEMFDWQMTALCWGYIWAVKVWNLQCPSEVIGDWVTFGWFERVEGEKGVWNLNSGASLVETVWEVYWKQNGVYS
jgi:hypothetical protein